MATLFFGVTGPTLDLRQDLTILDTDAPRIMAYLMASPYGRVTEWIETTTPDASWTPGEDQTEADRPTITSGSWVTRAATPDETAAAYARYVLNTLLADTLKYERETAAAAAADAITPITPVN